MAFPSLVLLCLALPLLAVFSNIVLRNRPNARDLTTFILAVATFVCVVLVFQAYQAGEGAPVRLFNILPGLPIQFDIEPLGLVFALIASGLWIVTHVYAVGYMRGNDEVDHTRFFACFSLAIFASIGIAFAGNLITLFLFYEILTLGTYPLVAHKGTPEALRGAKTYLLILMSTSILFLLPAIIWTWVIAGTLDFKLGGILSGKIEGSLTPVLLALFAFGISKAALMPFHRWLPSAMVAPTPVSALLHAVAVVKAGVFTMLKVGIYVFGIDFLAETGASQWLMWLAAFSILSASIVAMTKDNLKARLAYSTISQLSYITLGMALATSMGAVGGGLHIVTHALGKITLFMCAGSIYVATQKTQISDMYGLGRAMPITFAAFLIGSLSIIGLPPLGGSWSKWMLIMAAADTGQLIMIGVLMVSSVLNVAYLLPIVGRGFFSSAPSSQTAMATAKAPILCVIPLSITALGCLVLFFVSGDIVDFLMPIVKSVP